MPSFFSDTRNNDRGLSYLLHEELHWPDVPQQVQFCATVHRVCTKYMMDTLTWLTGSICGPPPAIGCLYHVIDVSASQPATRQPSTSDSFWQFPSWSENFTFLVLATSLITPRIGGCAVVRYISLLTLKLSLASPAMGNWGTCPLDFQKFNYFIQLYRCTKSDSDFVRLSVLPKILYSAGAAAVIQSRLHEACSVYYFASFYVRQKLV